MLSNKFYKFADELLQILISDITLVKEKLQIIESEVQEQLRVLESDSTSRNLTAFTAVIEEKSKVIADLNFVLCQKGRPKLGSYADASVQTEVALSEPLADQRDDVLDNGQAIVKQETLSQRFRNGREEPLGSTDQVGLLYDSEDGASFAWAQTERNPSGRNSPLKSYPSCLSLDTEFDELNLGASKTAGNGDSTVVNNPAILTEEWEAGTDDQEKRFIQTLLQNDPYTVPSSGILSVPKQDITPVLAQQNSGQFNSEFWSTCQEPSLLDSEAKPWRIPKPETLQDSETSSRVSEWVAAQGALLKSSRTNAEPVRARQNSETLPSAPTITINHYVPVVWSCTVSDAQIYLQLCTNQAELARLCCKLSKLAKVLHTLSDIPVFGQYVVAQFSEQWYRAKVVHVMEDGQSCNALFLDFGVVVNVLTSDLRDPRSTTVFSSPFFAIHMVLDNIKITNQTKALEVVKLYCEGKELRALFTENWRTSEIRHMCGNLYDEYGRNIGDILISQECAVPMHTSFPDIEELGWSESD